MRLADLLAALPGRMPLPVGAADLDVAGITADSRKVGPGMIFAALPGSATDGARFIADALARGAVAILAPIGLTAAAPVLHDAEPRRRLAQIAAIFAGAQPRTLAAVTGTNGKTSTVEFLRQLWALAGFAAASIGTLGLIAPGHPGGAGLTTPDPVDLAASMAMLAREGVQHAALEASSHGLSQYRLDGLATTVGGFTSLSRDHLDYHGTMAAYRDAKLRLFREILPRGASIAAPATLEPSTLSALRDIAAERGQHLHTVGEGGAAIALLSATPLPNGQALRLSSAGITREVTLNLPGRFQADNALVAAALAMATDVPDALDRLPALTGVRGRMERAVVLPNGAAVYVDYAHTPDALERLLAALRPHTTGRLLVVFGAGGDRDRGKRPLMGEAAARFADRAFVTDDNPRSEDPAAIRAAVRAGAPDAIEIGGREPAIAAAMAELRPGEVLAVAGKGHEQGQEIAGIKHPFDDVSVVRRLAGEA